MSQPDINAVKSYFVDLQKTICSELESEDQKESFKESSWKRREGGGGKSRLLRNGAIFEQAGVNFSHLHGSNLPEAATVARPELAGRQYEAMSLSAVAHPLNPYVPSSHLDLRFFVAHEKGDDPV